MQFSETVNGFTASDVVVSGPAGSTANILTPSPLDVINGTYTVAVSGMTADGLITVTIPAGVVTDFAGNSNTASTSTDNNVTYDATPPTVTINQAAAQVDPTNASPINFTVIFSEPVTNFATGDVTLSGTAGATTATVTGSGTTYNVAVSGMAGSGTVIASLSAGVASDAAGNLSTASTSADKTVTYDVTAPTVTIDQASGQADPTSGSPINFTVVFNEPVNNFATGDVTLGGTAGATTAVVTGSGTTYNVAVSGMTQSGTVIANIAANVATDAAGNANAASTSTDNTVTYIACQVSCPGNITVSNDAGQCGANVTYPDATTTGNCGSLTYSYGSPNTPTFFPIGTTTVTVTSPSTGSQCTFTVTVNDTEFPQITTCPGNQTLNTAPNQCASAPVSFTASASDNCSSGLTVKYFIGATEIAYPYSFQKGTTTVTVKAKDAATNETTCSFTVTVNDTQNPTVTPPLDVTVYTGPGATACNKLVSDMTLGTATANDNCPGFTVSRSGVPAGNLFPVGTTQVTYTVTDGASLQATATQNVTVIDNTLPVITAPANVTVYTGAGRTTCNQAASWTVPSPTDNCGIQSLTSNYNPGATFPVGTTTVTYTATDVNGNQSQCSFTVTVIDNTAPAVTGCPSNITVQTGPGNTTCKQTATWTVPTATDNCEGNIVPYFVSHTPGATFNLGATTVTYNFKDSKGNESICSFTVTVVDNTPPVISGCPTSQTITVSQAGCMSTATWTEPTATDNCTGGTLTYFSRSNAPGSAFPAGSTLVTYVFKDGAGNQSTCTFTITVNGTLNASIPNASAYTSGTTANTIYYGWTPASKITYTASASGGKTPYSYKWTVTPGLSIVGSSTASSVQVTSSAAGSYMLTLEVTDGNGCKKAATKAIAVADVRCGNKLDKVTVCKTTPAGTNCVNASDVANQLANGNAVLGPCMSGAMTVRAILDPTNSKPVVEKLTVRALPNPSRAHFTVEVNSSSIEKTQMQVYDLFGRLIEQRTVQPQSTVVIGGTYQPGTYFVRVTQGEQHQEVKLLKLPD